MQLENIDAKELSTNTKNKERKEFQKSTKSPDTVEQAKHIGTPKPEYRIQRTARFPFWEIKVSRGRLPDALAGIYTERAFAEKAIKLYDETATIVIVER